MSTQYIGLSHYSRVGKDSLANEIVKHVERLGKKAIKLPFARRMKEKAHEIYSWAGLREPDYYDTPEGEKFRDVKLAIGMTPVELWVSFGMWGRGVYERTWIDLVVKGDHDADVVVVPDCRFPNEAFAIREVHGKIIKVVRPGYGPRATVADRALLGYTDFDYVVGASGEMSELGNWGERFAWAAVRYVPWPVQTAEEKAAAEQVEVLPKVSTTVAA